MSRLPKHTIPLHYNINYSKLDLVTGIFKGSVEISLKFCGKTLIDSIQLHTLELHILDGSLKQVSSSGCDDASIHEYKLTEIRYCKRNQISSLLFDGFKSSELSEGELCVLSLDFSGKLNKQMKGLYQSNYTGLDGKNQVMACTQFEPTDARRAFPCFDEPGFKATFELSVTLDERLTCISNTPVQSTESIYLDGGILRRWKFSRTPKMSTYLLCLVTGKFDSISVTSSKTKIQTSVYTVRVISKCSLIK